MNRTILTAITVLLVLPQLAVCGTLYTVRESDNVLRAIDTNTMSFTDVGSLGAAFSFGGLAYDRNGDTMYMIDGRGAESLYTVDRSSGATTLIGGHGIDDLFGLAYDSTNNVLYASGESPRGLYTMNVATGAASLVGDPTVGLDGLAYDSLNDRLLGMYAGPGDLYELNRTTAAATLLLDGPFINNNGLAYDWENDLLWAIDWSGNLISYDPTNSFARTVVLSGLASHDGLTFVSAVPEPTTLAIWGVFGACGAGLATRRRRSGWTGRNRQAIRSVIGR